MKNNYAESKRVLDEIREQYGCKGEIIFRTALQYVVEFGQCMFSNAEWVASKLKDVDEKHDKAETEGKILWIARNFEKSFIECAAEIAKVDTYYLLIYIQKEIWLGHEGGIDYERAIQLLTGCMSNIEMWNDCQCNLTLHELEDIGFDDDEISELGFGYVLSAREEEYDD